MKRIVGAAFLLSAFGIILAALYQEANARPGVLPPVAICDKGKCVMAQEDFDTLKAFHSAIVKSALDLEEREREYLKAIDEQNRAIASLSSRCGGRRT